MQLNKREVKELMKRIEQMLKAEFVATHPGSEIQVSKGWGDNIHVLVVSEAFKGMPAEKRDDMVWPILEKLPKTEMTHISLCLLLTPEEAETPFATGVQS